MSLGEEVELRTGSITTLATNPIWTVQTAQSAHAVIVPKTYAEAADAEKAGTPVEGDTSVRKVKLGAFDAVSAILKKDGLTGFWRGIGPALILVINPVIQVGLAFPPLPSALSLPFDVLHAPQA